MFEAIKRLINPPEVPPTEEELLKERSRKDQIEASGDMWHISNNAPEWFGYDWKEIHGDYFGYYHMQGQFFDWRERKYTKGDTVSLLKMGMAFGNLYRHFKKATTEYPTPEETAFIGQSRGLWEQLKPSFGRMDEQRAIEVFFAHCDGPDTPLEQRQKFQSSCPPEVTYLFHTKRARCSSVDQARELDQAYYEVFRAAMVGTPETNFEPFLDHPYTPVLDGTLDAAIPLPGVEQELSPTFAAITHAKIELIILNSLLAKDYAIVRDYLGMKGTRLTDYTVSTGALAVEDSEVYTKFVEWVIRYAGYLTGVVGVGNGRGLSQEQAMDWVFFCVPLMVRDINAGMIENHDRSDHNWGFEKAPERYGGYNYDWGKDTVVEQMETYSDRLQKQREEAAEIFAQFPHLTEEKAAPVVVAVPGPVIAEETPALRVKEYVLKPVIVEAPQEEGANAPAPLSAMAQPFVKTPREKLPPGALSVEMTEPEAREIFSYKLNEKVMRVDLWKRYEILRAKDSYTVLKPDIDQAFEILLKIAA